MFSYNYSVSLYLLTVNNVVRIKYICYWSILLKLKFSLLKEYIRDQFLILVPVGEFITLHANAPHGSVQLSSESLNPTFNFPCYL